VLSITKTISDNNKLSSVRGPNYNKVPEIIIIKTEDLINFSASNKDIRGTKYSEEDIILLDNNYNDLSNFKGLLENI
jgi:hypothetical protein